MSEEMNNQVDTAALMDDSGSSVSSFHTCDGSDTGDELSPEAEVSLQQILPFWKVYQESKQGKQGPLAISSNITEDVNKFIPWLEGLQVIEEDAYTALVQVNWPDLKQYWQLCRVEWQLHKSPNCGAHLQLYLLVPDLCVCLTWTKNLRVAGACVSLCTVGATLVHRQKLDRIINYTYLPPSELVVLYMWAVPVTASRLLSVTLFLTLHPYWALAAVVVHLVLRVGFCCSTARNLSELNVVIVMRLDTLQFLISPFAVTDSITKRRVYHVTHFLLNTAMMVPWALGTPLHTAHPDLSTAIICANAVMFAVGLVGWQLHEKHWPDSYPKRND